MNKEDFLRRFENVKQTGPDAWSARCPGHDDKVNSLSLSAGEGKFLLHCHAGCSTESILSAAGLTFRDLFEEPAAAGPGPDREAEYLYYNAEGRPVLKKVRLRRPDGSKSFFWQRLEDDVWINGRGEISPPLYGTRSVQEDSELLLLVEGEKDCDNIIARFGLPCVSLPDGAKRDSLRWNASYDPYFRGRSVYILQDNDDVGKAFARLEARQILPLAEKVYLLDLAEIWPDIPPKGDISDMIEALGAEEAFRRFHALCEAAEPWRDTPSSGASFSCFKTLDQMAEEEPRWFIDGWIPEGQITLLASDGGIGKTSVAVNIAANRSAGRPCILDDPDLKPEPQTILFISTEDSVKMTLKRKFRESGANMGNILVPDFSGDREGKLRDLKFVTEYMKELIRMYRPALCVFDPLQGFIPPNINMGSRNAMRDCLAPLSTLGEETGSTFLILCHTNKRKGASGRDRLADSADIWDIARSVLMMGFTPEKGMRYLSHEKTNYGKYQETRLFTMDPLGRIQSAGTTRKRDSDFQMENIENSFSTRKEDCKEWILQKLKENGDDMTANELAEAAEFEGFSKKTLERAKTELKKEILIDFYQSGSRLNKEFHIIRLVLPEGWDPSET